MIRRPVLYRYRYELGADGRRHRVRYRADQVQAHWQDWFHYEPSNHPPGANHPWSCHRVRGAKEATTV